MQLWSHSYRQNFHCGVNTNNITESFNNVFRKRYLPLRHDTTVLALVQILVEVVFPEQEMRYVQATVKQTTEYRTPKYPIPIYLLNRPHSVQGICLLNIERSKSIHIDRIIKQPEDGVFWVKKLLSTESSSDSKYVVSITEGDCTCPAFQTSKIPCKHMFAVFHHHQEWNWSKLPEALTEAPHITLDISVTEKLREDDNMDEHSPNESPCTSTEIPPHKTTGRKIYQLQKAIEDLLGQCRTLTFLTNDIPTLESTLDSSEKLAQSLKIVATIPGGENCPPVFKALITAGVQNSKIIHRAGARQRNKRIKRKTSDGDQLLRAGNQPAGRPRMKRLQRKKPVLLRQLSSPVKAKMRQAAAILRRGMLYTWFIISLVMRCGQRNMIIDMVC